ncbi:MAG: hypothetical protein VX325_05105 [Bacteroidota bacterium]|nr:hypothetical protein [Bacteroidota bacterium]
MLSKLEKELKKIAQQILDTDRFIDLEEISITVSTLYEKILLYKYLNKNERNSLKGNEVILKEEFETLKNNKGERIKPKFYGEKEIINEGKIDEGIVEAQTNKNHQNRDQKNINDQFARKLKIDFNDKNAFIKHLFNENKIIYHDIITTIESLNDFEEIKKFIKKVKIDYNNWEGKELYEKRFINLVHKNFL